MASRTRPIENWSNFEVQAFQGVFLEMTRNQLAALPANVWLEPFYQAMLGYMAKMPGDALLHIIYQRLLVRVGGIPEGQAAERIARIHALSQQFIRIETALEDTTIGDWSRITNGVRMDAAFVLQQVSRFIDERNTEGADICIASPGFLDISAPEIGVILENAVSGDLVATVEALQARIGEFPLRNFEQVLVWGAENSQPRLFCSLLRSPQFQNVSEGTLGTIAMTTLRNGNLEALKALKTSGRFHEIPFRQLGEGIFYAYQNESLARRAYWGGVWEVLKSILRR